VFVYHAREWSVFCREAILPSLLIVSDTDKMLFVVRHYIAVILSSCPDVRTPAVDVCVAYSSSELYMLPVQRKRPTDSRNTRFGFCCTTMIGA